MAMSAKSEKAQGNTYILMCNTFFYNQWQSVMGKWVVEHKSDNAFLYSKEKNGYIKLGATYSAYEYAGNTLICKLDRSFDVEFPNRAFGAIIDLTADSATGRPALGYFTFKGGDLIQNIVNGVGGATGLQGGVVSSPVAGVKYIDWGYASVN